MPTVTAPKKTAGADSNSGNDVGPGNYESWETVCLSRLFSALGDPTRLTILRVLRSKGEMCVTNLASVVQLSVSAVSHQLRLLRDRELIRARRKGRMVWYSISDQHIAMLLDIGFEHAQEDCRERRSRGKSSDRARDQMRYNVDRRVS